MCINLYLAISINQRSQITSVAFGKRCEEMSVNPSMGTVGDAYDNDLAESFSPYCSVN